jgi:O-antigen ligase
LWGQGLGTTGAAALRSEPERAFVTESQVLKSLTELGILGLVVFAYLWYRIGRTGFSSLIDASDRYRQVLLLGIFTSLLIVFIEGFVYQNLEVKQVNAYFWVLTGMLAYLSGQADG